MKKIATILLILLAAVSHAQFVHPGMLHAKKDLDFIRARVAAGEAPWLNLFEVLKASPAASLSWTAQPFKTIVVGFFSKPDIGGTSFSNDGTAAYSMALAWYITRNKAYAEKSVEILNAWSSVLDSITDKNKKLLLGMNGIKYLNAAEIIRYSYKGWKKKDQAAFTNMALTNWYPLLEDFMPSYNGNWDAAIVQTMLCIGIFCDRQDIFDKAFQQALKGASNGAINNYFNEWGQCQESGRDQGHTQMGLGFLTTACEIAWKQGKDLYSAYDNRLALGYEYTAKYMLGEDVKYVRYTTFENKAVFGDTIAAAGRGKFSPVYERVSHHYHDRMGKDMPYTRQVLNKHPDELYTTGFMPWASLMTRGFPVRE